eukprot:CAMPEP_0119307056 /NCGR_PEP_ID=MMETSP1333-20130426/7660_1 /TAXON_ID=418940 /ORGANISM="Scyphosphaera apsteinii, Strain RCC1455" /LENGTH=150 /DNA_ID=CAMNT_0007310523 /DNA_START=620 /DNA_END=1072 /DNA_ORIENTATION=-
MASRIAIEWHQLRHLLSREGFTETATPPQVVYELFGAEALVHRCRIRQRTRDAWQKLANASRAVVLHSNMNYALEGSFHHVMGEPWARPFVVTNRRRIKHTTCDKRRIKAKKPDRLMWDGMSELSLRTNLLMFRNTTDMPIKTLADTMLC